MPSRELGQALSICPSYARYHARRLVKAGYLGVRGGPGGGYYPQLPPRTPASTGEDPAGPAATLWGYEFEDPGVEASPEPEGTEGLAAIAEGLIRLDRALESLEASLDFLARGHVACSAAFGSLHRRVQRVREVIGRARRWV